MHPTEKALRAIQKFVGKQMYFPSYEDLAKILGVTKGSAQNYILALEKMKLLERNNRGRIITIAVEVPENTKWSSFYLLSPSSHGKRKR